jgi:hypothetical protein
MVLWRTEEVISAEDEMYDCKSIMCATQEFFICLCS